MDFLTLRRRVIEKYFNNMNDRQFEAVTTVNGPLLVLAGAGSGKPTVLVNRILNLIKFGDAYQSDYTGYFSDEDLSFIGELKDSAKSEDVERSWETTVCHHILNKGKKSADSQNKNVLLEFTATVPETEEVQKKYENKN